MRSALVIVTCLCAAACAATGPGLRPLESGFATRAGVADPYEDGKRHLSAGRYDLAAERFGQALADDRHSIDALNGLAIAYSRLGRFEIAQTYFERALQVDPTSALTLNNYGWALVEQGRLRGARPFLELALDRAADADLPVVAGNIESIGRARPPSLIPALQSDRRPEVLSRHRLIRLADNRYRLETMAGAVARSEPAAVADQAPSPHAAPSERSAAVAAPEQAQPGADRPVTADRVDPAGSKESPAEQAAAPGPAPPADPPFGQAGTPTAPQPSSQPEAAATLAGDNT